VAPRRSWLFVLALWLASRVFFFAVGAAGHAWIREAEITVERPPRGSLAYWANWDGVHFLNIARHGYETREQTSFFPLYAFVIRGVSFLGPSLTVAALLVSLAASFFALFFLHELARALHGERAARLAAAALAFFPTAFFLNAAYSEALFLAVSGASLWALYVQRDALVAGLLAYFAALTRSFGVFLVVPLAWEWLRSGRARDWSALIGIAAPLIAFATYCFYLWRVARQPLLFNIAYERWGRAWTDPARTVWRGLHHADDGLPYLLHPARVFDTTSLNPPFFLARSVDFAAAVVLLVLLAFGLRMLPLGLVLYSLPAALIPMSFPTPDSPLVAVSRYALAVLPLFIVLGALLARSRVAATLWFVASIAVGVLLTLEFVTFRWVA
jgi:hypothetical protein